MANNMSTQSKILVIDDEPDIRELLKDILEDEGYAVEVAEHALRAIELKPVFNPDLVLLDIWMPEMDGVSLLKLWNEQKELTSPVVMMSGHGTVETAVEATRYGAFDFVEKPLSMAKLLRTVKSALQSQQGTSTVQAQKREEPVGNSHQMQQLRLTMQELAQHTQPVFVTGLMGSGVSIWVDYLFHLRQPVYPVQSFQADDNYYQNGLTGNVYIHEVSDLNRHGQQVLLSLLQRLAGSPSMGRLVVGSQYSYEQLRGKSEIIPEIAEYWRNAINIPELDERIEDIPELLEYYVNWYAELEGLPYRHFGVAAQNMIRNHRWAGGLTELKSLIRQLLTNSDADNVELGEIQSLLMDVKVSESSVRDNHLNLYIDLNLDMREAREFFEREYLRQQLEICHNNVSDLARKIGLERTNLYRKLKALGLHSRK
jgi:two-component system, NtrC family, nitrogen regulation response regulator NtrX